MSGLNIYDLVFASYCSKAQNTTCTIWLLGYNILCISAYEQSVCQMISKMLHQNCTQVSEEFLERYRCDTAKIYRYFTTGYSGWNVDPPLRTEQQSMQWNERFGQNCHFITLQLRFSMSHANNRWPPKCTKYSSKVIF